MLPLIPVIMSGGVGSRLWPLSRELYPKQLLPLVNETTLIQDTVIRLNGLKSEAPMVICNVEQRFLIADQLKDYGVAPDNIILEPVGRNTAPAVAVAAIEALKAQEDALLLVLAADHAITDIGAFQESVKKGLPLAEKDFLVTFGIVPSKPETGYGYIKSADKIGSGFKVAQFVEKPDQATAESYVKSGDYFWNSGMFLLKASKFIEELKKHAPEIYQRSLESVEKADRLFGFVQLNQDEFAACPEDSIDYAVMEKTDSAAVIPMDAGWNDVGSWSALYEIANKDNEGNVFQGDVYSVDTENCFVRSEKRMVATIGIDDLVIVDTADALMVAHKDQSQNVKEIVKQLKCENRTETQIHTKAFRPWGNYETIDESDRFKVKRIVVNPGSQLSLQMHHHRAEHWIVVKGSALVTKGDESFLLTENESTYIPVGQTHRLENPGQIPLEMIEVQSGSYLGEDDIVRFSDIYGRSDKQESEEK